MARSFKSTRNLTAGGEYKQNLRFVPDADNKPKVGHEISDPALFRFLLNEEKMGKFDEADEVEIAKMLDVLKDIDKQLKITQVEVYQSSMNPVTNWFDAFHVFIVFKSTSETADDGIHWWSLENNTEYIVLQRFRKEENVKNKLEGKQRTKVKLIEKDLKGKGTIQDLFAILWAQQVIPENYNIFYSDCQFLVTFVGEQITEIGYKFKGYCFFPYSLPRESGWDKQILELINVIRGCSYWSLLFHLIKMGNTDLIDKTVASGKYDINASCNGLTPLHLAIRLRKTKMVQHLLQPPMNGDPTKRDAYGKSALILAASMSRMKAKIIDFLLEHDKVNVDDVDENGQTALHFAASLHFHQSNVVNIFQKLLEKGANPNIFEKKGTSPLHVAAVQRDGNPIIDLLLEAQKVKGMGDVNDAKKQGRTALHYAAAHSNEITAEHLIKKGADLHCRDNNGHTPLHYAALGAEDMKIIDLLLENINEGDIQQYRNDEILFFFAGHNLHGLGNTIIDRLVEKSIKPPCSIETDDCTAESDEATDVNTRRFVDKGADPSIDLTGFDGIDFLIARVKISLEIDDNINGRDQNGETLLLVAIRANNVDWVINLLERGADPTIRDEKGITPFHVAVENCRDFDILNLLLESGKVDINETTTEYGRTALHMATRMALQNSNLTTARFLLSKGSINPNVANKDGETPLHWAALFAKDLTMVELLLNHTDVDVNCLSKWGYSALDHATMNTHKHELGERIANLLKEKGALEIENLLPKGNISNNK